MIGGLVLGPVVFQDFEVPERVRFGGEQRLAVHTLPGGGRVVDAMGASEAPICWEGVFSGGDVALRIRVIEELRRSGAALPLSWGGWRFTVVVESFEAEAANPAWVPYRIRACVLAVGDVVVPELLPLLPTVAEALALGAGPGVDGRIGAASVALGSAVIGTSIDAAGQLARLVAGKAYGTALGIAT